MFYAALIRNVTELSCIPTPAEVSSLLTVDLVTIDSADTLICFFLSSFQLCITEND